MSSNGTVGCPEDMQVESAPEGSLKHHDTVVEKPSTLSNSIADTNGNHYIGVFNKALHIY